MGKGAPQGAPWVLMCRDTGRWVPGSPHDLQPPPTSHLRGCAQGIWGGGRKLLGAGARLSPALPPPRASPGLSLCSVLGQSGLVCSHLPSSLQSTSLCLCNALSTGQREKRSLRPKPPASPPLLSSPSGEAGSWAWQGDSRGVEGHVLPVLSSFTRGGWGGGGRQRDPVAVTGEGERGEGILLGINE